ncbi:hypothetical protein Tco_1210803 [Tanacetum coccineum]
MGNVAARSEFDIEIKDKKGTENVAADHLSRIENDETSDDSEVDDNFPRETLMEMNTEDEPCTNGVSTASTNLVLPELVNTARRKINTADGRSC